MNLKYKQEQDKVFAYIKAGWTWKLEDGSPWLHSPCGKFKHKSLWSIYAILKDKNDNLS